MKIEDHFVVDWGDTHSIAHIDPQGDDEDSTLVSTDLLRELLETLEEMNMREAELFTALPERAPDDEDLPPFVVLKDPDSGMAGVLAPRTADYPED